MQRVIKEARLARYLEGWVAALDAINLPLTSSFRDLSQVPLPKDLPVENSPSFCELLEEIEAHTTNAEVINQDNLIPPGTVQPSATSDKSKVAKTTPNSIAPATE
ncbi:hypothetical protein SO802_026580 [Lithocarpus litseifolius]|uniref:Uncharacterized protein n=1 Tax=Lithocarpus litseifolius TaxID=425828 RepID=A0AAW2BZX9_9ROSI